MTKRSESDRLANLLSEAGVDAAAYHAGLDRSMRQRVQVDFIGGTTRVVVATVAFGMGINKSDVRWVIHWDVPKSLERAPSEHRTGDTEARPHASLRHDAAHATRAVLPAARPMTSAHTFG